MNKSKKIIIISLICMTIVSILSILKIKNLSSITIVLGIVMYFVAKKNNESENLLSFKGIPKALKSIKVIILILMPTVANIICSALANAYLPEFNEHLVSRIDFLSIDKLIILIIELLIAALGEEIAWRGFYQNQSTKYLKFVPSLIITSVLFGLCHISDGSMIVVLYDLAFIAINSIFYGLVFKKTNNVYVCTISHFLANVVSILMLI